MAALTPENVGGAFKSIWGRFLGLLGDDLGHRHLWIGGPNGKIVSSTRNPIQTTFTGSNGAGACTLTNALVGDIVVSVINLTTPADASTSFESTISVAAQIQQSSASNLSGNTYLVLTRPQS